MYTLVNYGSHGPCVACAELYTRPTYSLTLYTHIMWYISIKLMTMNLEKGRSYCFTGPVTDLHLISLHYATHYKNVLEHEDNALLAYTA